MKKIIILGFCLLLIGCQSTTDNSGAIDHPTTTVQPTINTLTASTIIVPNTVKSPTPDPTIDWMNQEIDYGKVGIFIIVDALEAYYQDNAAYPETLDELMPVYLNQLPSTIDGNSFSYNKNETSIYYVGYRLTRTGGENIIFACGYTRVNEVWECSAGHP